MGWGTDSESQGPERLLAAVGEVMEIASYRVLAGAPSKGDGHRAGAGAGGQGRLRLPSDQAYDEWSDACAR